MSNHAYQNVKRLAPILKLLGEPNRLRILLSLGLECRPVTDVVQATGMSETNVSFHLRALREAGLVRPERRGPFVYYCLPDPRLLDILHDLAEWFDKRGQQGPESASAPRAPASSAPSR